MISQVSLICGIFGSLLKAIKGVMPTLSLTLQLISFYVEFIGVETAHTYFQCLCC